MTLDTLGPLCIFHERTPTRVGRALPIRLPSGGRLTVNGETTLIATDGCVLLSPSLLHDGINTLLLFDRDGRHETESLLLKEGRVRAAGISAERLLDALLSEHRALSNRVLALEDALCTALQEKKDRVLFS